MRQVNRLVLQESSRVLATASNVTSQQEMGGFLRATVPGLIDRYGKVNAAAARRYYDEQRLAAFKGTAPGATRSARVGARRAAERVAAARTRSALYVAKLPKFDAIAKSETIVNYGMALFMGSSVEAMQNEVGNALTRAVASYNRDTLLYNSALDDAVVGVQRVAEPNACDFCQTVAFDSYGGARVTDYAIEFHNNCQCSIETIFEGDKPFRPDYYDDFEYGDKTANAPEGAYRTEGWGDFRSQFMKNYVSA
jgi:hypothetical protein